MTSEKAVSTTIFVTPIFDGTCDNEVFLIVIQKSKKFLSSRITPVQPDLNRNSTRQVSQAPNTQSTVDIVISFISLKLVSFTYEYIWELCFGNPALRMLFHNMEPNIRYL